MVSVNDWQRLMSVAPNQKRTFEMDKTEFEQLKKIISKACGEAETPWENRLQMSSKIGLKPTASGS